LFSPAKEETVEMEVKSERKRVIIHGYQNDTDGWLNDFEMLDGKIISSGLKETFRDLVKKAGGSFFAAVTAAELSDKNGRSERTNRRRLEKLEKEAGLIVYGKYFDKRTGKEKRGYFLVAHEYVERRYRWEEEYERDKHSARYKYGKGQYIFEISESSISGESDFSCAGFDSPKYSEGFRETVFGHAGSTRGDGFQASDNTTSFGNFRRKRNDRQSKQEDFSHDWAEFYRECDLRGISPADQRSRQPVSGEFPRKSEMPFLAGDGPIRNTTGLGDSLAEVSVGQQRRSDWVDEEKRDHHYAGRDQRPDCAGIPLSESSSFTLAGSLVPEIQKNMEAQSIQHKSCSSAAAASDLSGNEAIQERVENNKDGQDLCGGNGHFGDKMSGFGRPPRYRYK